ncbi:MAG: hypothetical protein AAF503_07185 [Pseudomonadota bacterium]
MPQHDQFVSDDSSAIDHNSIDRDSSDRDSIDPGESGQRPSQTIHLFRQRPTVLGLWRRELRFPSGWVMQGDSDLNRVLRQG